jgi:hypothetical protein
MNIKRYGKLLKQIAYTKAILEASRFNTNFFTRNSLLTFPMILLYLLNMQKTALQARGNHFFRQATGGMCVTVSKQAISQRRNSFDHTPFLTMFRELVKEEYSGEEKLSEWNGHIITSIDGSYLQLPREDNLRLAFGVRGAGDCPMAGVSVLYDVLSGWPLDAIITHSKLNERTECVNHVDFLHEHLPHIIDKLIITLDAGYPSLEVYSFFQSKNIKFLAKCSPKTLKEVMESPLGDHIITLRNGLKLRVIKIGDSLETATILVTNLFDFSMSEIIELYALRWSVETMFRIVKEHLFIEGFSGKTTNSIYQDFYATFVILISVAILQKDGNKIVKEVRKHNKTNKHEYEVNISNTVSIMRDRFIFLILFKPDGVCIESEIMDITYKIAASVVPKIKNRKFPRKPKPYYKAKHNLKVR